METYHVYILYSTSHDKYYVGQSPDLATRLLFHNELSRSSYASRYRPWELVWSVALSDRSKAMLVEKYLKKRKSRGYLEKLINDAEATKALLGRFEGESGDGILCERLNKPWVFPILPQLSCLITNALAMFDLKPLSKKAIPGALEKALRYRLINDPWQAESICRDILRADPDNQEAINTLVLSITDQFESKLRTSLPQAMEVVAKLKDPYQQDYCKGIIYERQATAALKRDNPRAGFIAYEFLRQAMEWYEKAEQSRPADNEESILRWNACARMIARHSLKPAPEREGIQPLLDV